MFVSPPTQPLCFAQRLCGLDRLCGLLFWRCCNARMKGKPETHTLSRTVFPSPPTQPTGIAATKRKRRLHGHLSKTLLQCQLANVRLSPFVEKPLPWRVATPSLPGRGSAGVRGAWVLRAAFSWLVACFCFRKAFNFPGAIACFDAVHALLRVKVVLAECWLTPVLRWTGSTRGRRLVDTQ